MLKDALRLHTSPFDDNEPVMYSIMDSFEAIQLKNKRKWSDGMILTLCGVTLTSQKYAVHSAWRTKHNPSIDPKILKPLAHALEQRRRSLRTLFSLLKSPEVEMFFLFIQRSIKDVSGSSCKSPAL